MNSPELAGKNSRVLGIDPGSRKCGYGVITADGVYVSSGTLILSTKLPLHDRLRELHEGLMEVINDDSPVVAVIESIFYAKSIRSALTLGHARGVALQVVSSSGLEVNEYTPLEVKKAVTGYGRADKQQVQQMVKRILGLDFSPSEDGADALALALCHINQSEYAK